MKNLIPFLFILLLFACHEKRLDSIQKCWVLAERDEDLQVYFPCGDERLPASRFSPTFKFYANDSCEYLVLSPNDAHYFKEGTYDYNLENSILTITGKEAEIIAKFKILDLEARQLKLEVLDATNYVF